MDSNPSGQDPRKIWQNQPRETSKITMTLIRQRAQDLHAKTRRALINSVISHVAAFLGCIVGAVLSPSAGQRIAYAVGAIYAVAGATIIHRGMWTEPMAGDAGLTTGVEFCRKELGRHRALFSRGLVWVSGPLIFAVGAYLVPALVASVYANEHANPRVLAKAIPFFALLGIWLVVMMFIRVKQRHGLQREIDDLNEIEKENR